MSGSARRVFIACLVVVAVGLFFVFFSPAIFGADPGGSASPGYNVIAGAFIALLGAVGAVVALVRGRRR